MLQRNTDHTASLFTQDILPTKEIHFELKVDSEMLVYGVVQSLNQNRPSNASTRRCQK